MVLFCGGQKVTAQMAMATLSVVWMDQNITNFLGKRQGCGFISSWAWTLGLKLPGTGMCAVHGTGMWNVRSQEQVHKGVAQLIPPFYCYIIYNINIHNKYSNFKLNIIKFVIYRFLHMFFWSKSFNLPRRLWT